MKIMYMGKQVRDSRGKFVGSWIGYKFYQLKCFVFRILRLSSLTLIVFAIIAGAIVWGQYHSVKIVEAEVGLPPVLQRIAKCESLNNTQYGKNGQVLLHWNTNKTVDIGKYAINNETWGKKAKEMGYDLTSEKDNEAFALWLFENVGSSPWSASAKCWSK